MKETPTSSLLVRWQNAYTFTTRKKEVSLWKITPVEIVPNPVKPRREGRGRGWPKPRKIGMQKPEKRRQQAHSLVPAPTKLGPSSSYPSFIAAAHKRGCKTIVLFRCIQCHLVDITLDAPKIRCWIHQNITLFVGRVHRKSGRARLSSAWVAIADMFICFIVHASI